MAHDGTKLAPAQLPPAESRSGFTHPFGKLGAPINGLQLPVEIEALHRQRAEEIRIPFREYLREVLSVAAVGHEEMKRATNDRLSAIAGKLQQIKDTE